jgi:hypothetical protein
MYQVWNIFRVWEHVLGMEHLLGIEHLEGIFGKWICELHKQCNLKVGRIGICTGLYQKIPLYAQAYG